MRPGVFLPLYHALWVVTLYMNIIYILKFVLILLYRDPAVPAELQQEGDITYKYEIYEKVK